MSTYRRPVIATETLCDPDGTVIDYGRRWPQGPPQDTYSVTRHPQRFRPLHAVADALVAWLIATYQVTAEDDLSVTSDLARPRTDVERAVRLTPTGGGATVAIVFTSFPGVVVRVADGPDLPYPACGCDACDESWEDLADELEESVRSAAHRAGWSTVPPGRSASAARPGIG
jgi:hypothetical protein